MTNADYNVIGVPLGTRLQQVVLVGAEVHIWTALGSRIGHYNTWLGTYMRVEPNGRVTMVTRRANQEDDVFEIKRADT